MKLSCSWYTCAGNRSSEAFETGEDSTFDREAYVSGVVVHVWTNIYKMHRLCSEIGRHCLDLTEFTLQYSVTSEAYICDTLFSDLPHSHRITRFITLHHN